MSGSTPRSSGRNAPATSASTDPAARDSAGDGADPDHLTVGVISAGRVGAVLGAAFARAGYPVVAAVGRSPESVERATRLLSGVPLRSVDQVTEQAQLLLLAVPDDRLGEVVGRLAGSGRLRPDHVVVHTSGAHGLAVLAPVIEHGATALAMHPAMTVTGTAADVERLAGVRYGVTATDHDQALAARLVADLRGVPVWVPEANRGLYHAALTAGANHLVTLVAEAADLLQAAGVDDPAGVLRPLLSAALDNALRDGDAALTGPVLRGDAGTVRRHVSELSEHAPHSLPAYVVLARRTADRAMGSGRLRPADAGAVVDALRRVPTPRTEPSPATEPPSTAPNRSEADPASRRSGGGAGGAA